MAQGKLKTKTKLPKSVKAKKQKGNAATKRSSKFQFILYKKM